MSIKDPCVFDVMWSSCKVAVVIGVVSCSDDMSTHGPPGCELRVGVPTLVYRG